MVDKEWSKAAERVRAKRLRESEAEGKRLAAWREELGKLRELLTGETFETIKDILSQDPERFFLVASYPLDSEDMSRYVCVLRASDGQLLDKPLSVEADRAFSRDYENGCWSSISQMFAGFSRTDAEALINLLDAVASQEYKELTADVQARHIQEFRRVITELARQINAGSQKNP